MHRAGSERVVPQTPTTPDERRRKAARSKKNKELLREKIASANAALPSLGREASAETDGRERFERRRRRTSHQNKRRRKLGPRSTATQEDCCCLTERNQVCSAAVSFAGPGINQLILCSVSVSGDTWKVQRERQKKSFTDSGGGGSD